MHKNANIKCSNSKVVDVDSLIPNPKNPNKHPEKQIKLLAKIIKHQGQRLPIVVSKRSGFIVSGHGRLEAIKSLGWAECAIDEQEFATEADEYAHMIADNKIAELAEHDDSMMIQDLKDMNFDLDFDLLGMLDFQLPPDPTKPQCDEDEIPEQVDTRCKRGDVWLLGNHRLMCGDSTMIDDVEKLMNGEKADMLLTDPPYNLASETKCSKRNTGKNQLRDAEWDKFFDPKKVLFFEFLKGSYSAYIFTSGYLFGITFEISKNFSDFCSLLVWKKTTYNSNLIKKHPTWNIEPIVYSTKGNHIFNYDTSDAKNALLEFAGEHQSRFVGHPTQKPVKMIESIIKNSSNDGFSILDLFGGSGTTLIACEKTNRKCYMMELDEKYCDVILTRWEKYTGKLASKLNG